MTSGKSARIACMLVAAATLYRLRRRLVGLLTVTSGTWIGTVTPAPSRSRTLDGSS